MSMRPREIKEPSQQALADAAEFRALFVAATAAAVEQTKRPLLMLSGGTDSLLIACALARLGLALDTLSVGFGDKASDDMLRARAAHAATLSAARHHELMVAASGDVFEDHVEEAVGFCGFATETMVEVTLLTFPAVRWARDHGYRELIFGFDASEHWACNRQQLKRLKVSHQEWADMRIGGCLQKLVDYPFASERATREYARDFRLRVADPYSDSALRIFSFQRDFARMNYQVTKGLARLAFPELTALRPLVKNFQSGCGVQQFAEAHCKGRYALSAVSYYRKVAARLGLNWLGEFDHYDKFRLRRDAQAIARVETMIERLRALRVTDIEVEMPEAIKPSKKGESA